MNSILDLAINEDEVIKLFLEHPKLGVVWADKEKLDKAYIELRSPSSDEVVKMKARQENLSWKALRSNKDMGSEYQKERSIERYKAFITGVHGLGVFADGEPVTADNIEKLLRDERFQWINQQIDRKLQSLESLYQD